MSVLDWWFDKPKPVQASVLSGPRTSDPFTGHVTALDAPASRSELFCWSLQAPGWVGFAMRLPNLLLAMGDFHPEKFDKNSRMWIPDEDAFAAEALAMLRSDSQETADLIYDSGWSNDTTGEWHLIYSPDQLGGFLVAQNEQIKKHRQMDTEWVSVELEPDARKGSDSWIEVPAKDAQRIWIKDPRWHRRAWSPLMGIASEIRGYMRALENIDDALGSHAGAGIVDLGDGLQLEPFVRNDGETEMVTAAHAFMGLLVQQSREQNRRGLPYATEGGQRGPSFVEVGWQVDSEAINVLRSYLEAAARGLDYPSQFLIDGLGDSKFANAWLLQEDAMRTGLNPRARRLSQQWTTFAYQPILAAMLKSGDVTDRRINLDLAGVAAKADRTKDFAQLYRTVGLRREVVAEAADLDAEDLLAIPDDVSEYEHWKTARGAGNPGVPGEPGGQPGGEPFSPNADPDDPEQVPASMGRNGFRPHRWDDDADLLQRF